MSITANFGLLSGTGTQSLQSFLGNKNYTNALSTISGYNSSTGQNHSFYSGSIFSNSAGTNNYSSFELTGMIDGMSSSFYSKGGFGSSIVGNIYNAMNNVALGQGKAISVFEQRLAYSMGLPGVPQTYYPDNYSNEFSLSSSSSSRASSSYNVFAANDKSSANTKTALNLSLMG